MFAVLVGVDEQILEREVTDIVVFIYKVDGWLVRSTSACMMVTGGWLFIGFGGGHNKLKFKNKLILFLNSINIGNKNS